MEGELLECMMYPERDEILKDIGKATIIWWLLKIIF